MGKHLHWGFPGRKEQGRATIDVELANLDNLSRLCAIRAVKNSVTWPF